MAAQEDTDVLRDIYTDAQDVDLETLEQTIRLAVEIAREGREGRKIGTLFVVGDDEETLRQSTCLILDPLGCHPKENRRLGDPSVRGTSTPHPRVSICPWDWAAATSPPHQSQKTQMPSPSSSRRARWCVSLTTGRLCRRSSLNCGFSDARDSISRPPIPLGRTNKYWLPTKKDPAGNKPGEMGQGQPQVCPSLRPAHSRGMHTDGMTPPSWRREAPAETRLKARAATERQLRRGHLSSTMLSPCSI
jgi:hypothetical protein